MSLIHGIVAAGSSAEAAGGTAKSGQGSFLTGTGAVGTPVNVSGIVDENGNSFTPLFVILHWTGLSGSGTILQRNDIREGVGVAISASDQRNAGGQSMDAAATTSTDGQEGDESAVRVLNTSGALAGALAFVSFGDGTMEFEVTTAFATDLRIEYQAFGGTVLEYAQTGMLDEPAATGNQVHSGILPDTADFLMVWGCQSLGTPPDQLAHHSVTLGFAVRGGNQAFQVARDRDANGTTFCHSYQESGHLLGRLTFNANTVQAKASITAWSSTGFTWNWSARSATGVNYHYLAVKGGRWAVNEIFAQTDLVTVQSITGLLSPPVAAMFLAYGGLEAGTPDTVCARSLGFANKPSSQRVSYFLSQGGGLADSVCMAGRREDSIYMAAEAANPVATLRGRMHIQSWNTDGLTTIMGDAEPNNPVIHVLTFGP